MFILMFLGEKGEGNDPRKEFWCLSARNMHSSMFAGHKDSLVLVHDVTGLQVKFNIVDTYFDVLLAVSRNFILLGSSWPCP